MLSKTEQEPNYSTWVLKPNAYSKRVIPKNGLVFEMTLLDGRFAIGFVLIAKFGAFRAPLTEILAVCEAHYDPRSITPEWVYRHHEDPLMAPVCVEPMMFSKLGMTRRLRLVDSPVSECDILELKQSARLDPTANVFVPGEYIDGKYVSSEYTGDMSTWEVVDCNGRFNLLGAVPGKQDSLVVPPIVPLAGNYDLLVAQRIAFEEGGEMPTVERSKVEGIKPGK